MKTNTFHVYFVYCLIIWQYFALVLLILVFEQGKFDALNQNLNLV